MNVSMENISPNADKSFIYPLIDEFSKLMENYKVVLNKEDVSFNGRNISAKEADKLKEIFRQTSMTKNINNICDIISKRFGFKLEMVVDFNGGGLAYVLTPPLDTKTIGVALEDIDILFPKKRLNAILWDTIASNDEKRVYKTLKNVSDSIKKGQLKVNTAKGYIEGLDDSTFLLHFDALSAFVNNLNPDEIVAVVMHEIGHVFTYLEHIFYSTKNTLVLLDSFIHEKFDKGKGDKESITIALQDTGVNVDTKSSLGILQALDMFTLKTYRIDIKKGIMNIDFERQADQFATRLGLGGKLSSAIVKLSSLGTIQPDKAENEEPFFITLMKTLMIIGSALLTILIFNIFGVLVLILLFGVKFLTFVLGYVTKLITSLIGVFFKDTENDYGYDDLVKRLRKIKLDIIRQLRKQVKTDKAEKFILTQQIDSVKDAIDLVAKRFSITVKWGDSVDNLNTTDNREIVNEMLEMLEENDNYYYAEKFQQLADKK